MTAEGLVERELRFAFFGDSICVGQGVSPHRTWAVRLAQRIEAELASAGRRVCVLNPSINGDTTRKALERMAFDIQAAGVDAILVQFGLNDANRWESDRGLPRVSEAAFAANLEEIIARARAFGAGPVLLNTNHPTTRHTQPFAHHPATYEAGNRRYNEIIREVAARDGQIVLTDIEAAFRARLAAGAALESLVLADGLHLSEAGHDLYLDLLTPPALAAARQMGAVCR
ncbi:SGNH/GDSL hydrolase family protein [Hyphomonas sp.]|jgi:lysophospholipase L1-like esterase|uniref:SGNH/GDSL hydrolase family protein n=1 Tax=Hyphomonas sp. TaxID=87 RepID=UPI00391B521D